MLRRDAADRRRSRASGDAIVSSRPKVAILGAGFGGLFAAKGLAGADIALSVVDRHNYHLFQPLLYQVAVAGLPPSDIAWPIRSILSRQENCTVLMDEVWDIDVERREVLLRHSKLAYDFLVVATGSTHSYFGHDEWRPIAPGLKSIDDATLIRRRILTAFERAEMTLDSEERERLLKFVVVGGGPTGVELAGTIAELARYTLARDFRGIDPRDAKIILVEGTGRLLPTLDPTLGEFARGALERLGVEVRLECIVTACDATSVTAGGQRIGTATAIWAAGVEASPVARWLDVPAKPNGTVAVMPNLSAPGLPHVFVIGDAAYVVDDTGRRVPGIAPAAKQQGRYVAEQIRRELAGKPAQKPFRYRHAGNLATIGRQAAVIDAPHFRLKGWLAWWIWGIAHIYFLIGMRSPLLISIHWLWEYLTYGRGARLITGTDRAD